MPVNGWEFVLLIVLAFIILGPSRMPDYAAKLARFVVQLRRMANDAKVQLKDQMGPDFEDLDWRQYDPRQYDPRRIVKEALMEPLEDAFSLDGLDETTSPSTPDDDPPPPSRRTASGVPWDDEAT